ncbi:unnamed protein product [Closterium sp. Naga37s-1]|nr:unnamed protein product [Closterium sp. Naga37s-1]
MASNQPDSSPPAVSAAAPSPAASAAATAAVSAVRAPIPHLPLPSYTVHQSQRKLFSDTAAFAIPPPPPLGAARASDCRRVLVVHRGDITKWCVDGATDAIGSRLGGLDAAIHKAAGPALKKLWFELPVLRNGHRCEAGDAVTTG